MPRPAGEAYSAPQTLRWAPGKGGGIKEGNGENGKKEQGRGKEARRRGSVFASVKIKSWVRP